MEILELMKARHSVRKFVDKKIELETRNELDKLIKDINKISKLNIQIVYDDPECFKSIFSKVARFQNCSNYVVMAGHNSLENLHEIIGYYGEKIVLKAQELGLNTCWVGLTYGKIKAKLLDNEKVIIVIALGYGLDNGTPHKSKKIEDVSNVYIDLPEWYQQGLEAALLAPTALNQQKFKFEYTENLINLIPLSGPYTLVDAGIVKYHFEIISGKKVIIKK